MKKKLIFVGLLLMSVGASQARAEDARQDKAPESKLKVSDMLQVHHLKQTMKSQDSDAAGDAANRLADILVKNGYSLQAMTELEKYVVEHDPLNFELRLRMAQMYRDALEYDHAMEHVQVLQKMRPRSSELALLKGSIQVETGQYTEAAKTLSGEGNSIAVSSEMTLYKAFALNGLKKYKEALETTRMVLNLNRIQPLALLASAEANLGQGSKAEALKSLYLLVKNRELTPYLLVKGGKFFREAGDLRASKDFYLRAYELQPDRTATAIELARDFFDLEDYASAKKVLEDTLSRQPDNDRVIYHLARTYSQMGEVDQAGKVVGKYWEKAPSQAWVASAYARALALADNKARAIEVLKKTISLESGDYSEAIVTLGDILGSQEQYKDALEVLHKGEAKFPSEPSVKAELGKIYSNLGDIEKASYWASASKKAAADKSRAPGSVPAIDDLKEKVLR